MLSVSNLSKAYSANALFNDVTFSINSGERVGLVGRNGHGKSTLFKIIAGLEDYDSGNVRIPRDYKIGYLEQKLDFKNASILAYACQGIPTCEDGIDQSYKAKAILLGLGIESEQFDLKPSVLSGGFQIRLNLVKLLVSEPNLLLLDEPTNYLDILSMRWLERFLQNWPGELMVITHDRDFMDSISTHTLGIYRQSVVKIPGPTGNYYDHVNLQEEMYEKTRVGQVKKRQETEAFVNRFRAKASKAKAVQSRIKMLDKEEVLEELSQIKNLDFKFPYEEFKGKWPVHIKQLSFAYSNDATVLIDNFSASIKNAERIGIIGKNGKGKSTLLRLIAGELPATNGNIEVSANAKLQYFGQTNVDRLRPDLTIEEEMQSVNPLLSRTLIRTICGLMMFSGDLANKKIKVLSGGERARVLLGKILLQPGNLLLLDEPTNHLDMESNEALLEAIKIYPGTVLIVTHNEHFLKEVATRLIVFDADRVELLEYGYKDFLRQRGWQAEGLLGNGLDKSKSSGPAVNKKELRRLKAEINLRRNQELKPLIRQVDKLEKEIIALEQQITEQSEQLIAITTNGFNDEAAKLSRSINQAKARIEQAFEELEKASQAQAALEQELNSV